MKREALKRRRIKTGEREGGGKKRKDQSGGRWRRKLGSAKRERKRKSSKKQRVGASRGGKWREGTERKERGGEKIRAGRNTIDENNEKGRREWQRRENDANIEKKRVDHV